MSNEPITPRESQQPKSGGGPNPSPDSFLPVRSASPEPRIGKEVPIRVRPAPHPTYPGNSISTSISPLDTPWLFEPDVTFWKPGWRDRLPHLGPRIYLVIPLLAIPILVYWFDFDIKFMRVFLLGGGKLILLMLGAVISAIGYARRAAVQSRQDPFCIHCGYGLTGLPDHHRCPECGQPYTFALIEEYRRDPAWFIRRCKMGRQIPTPDQAFAAGPVRTKRRSRDGT